MYEPKELKFEGFEFKMTSPTLANKQILIIGGSSGIGLATAVSATELGAKVTIASRSTERLTAVLEEHPTLNTAVCDITRPNDVAHLFSRFAHVDHVFMTAGQSMTGNLVNAELVTLRTIIDQRIWGLVHVVKSAAPKMSDGSLTFISGQWASRPSVGAAFMGASIAAVEALTRGLALELAPIRVNAIAPGVIETPILGDDRDRVDNWAKTTLPLKRMGQAEEVAQAALMLMSNNFITGEILHIDGGGRLV